MPEFGFFIGDEIYDCDFEEVPPIIESILYEQDFMLLHAKEGAGKSVLVQQWMHNLTTGSAFLGTYEIPNKKRVLWCQGEGSRAKHVGRVCDMKKLYPIDDTHWYHYNHYSLNLGNEETVNKFIDLISIPDVQYDVIVFDSLYGFVPGSFNDDSVAKVCCKHLRAIAGQFGASLIVIGHKGKDQKNEKGKTEARQSSDVFGSRTWGAFFTVVYELKEHQGKHFIDKGKDRDGNCISKVRMRMIRPQDDDEGRLGFISCEEGLTQAGAQIVYYLKDNKESYCNKVCEAINISHATFYECVKDLVKQGKVVKTRQGRKVYYSLKVVE